ncbi:MAG TPA: autotransporter-associated beta strand repeat-containing protein, partial [Humisphaera sp.]
MQKSKGLSGGRGVRVCASRVSAGRRLRSASAAAAAALGLFAGPVARAQTTYTGTVDNNWSTPGNWTAGEPTLSVDAILGAPLAGNPVVLDAAGEQALSLTFNANYILNSGSLTLGNGTVTVDPSVVGTINSVLNGTNGLTLNPTTGTGTLVLTGANGFAGTVAVQGGTLRVGADANLGAAANTVALGTGTTTGALDYTGNTATISRAVALGTTASGGGVINVATAGQTLTLSGVISGGAANATAATTLGSTSLTITGAGKVALTGTNTFTGNIVVDGGTLVFGGTDAQLGATAPAAFKTVVLQNGGTFAQTGGAPYNPTDGTTTNTANKRFLIGAGGGTIDVGSGFTLQLDDAGQFGGTAAGGSLTKAGAGRLQLVAPYTSYDAAQTYVTGGALELRAADALGDAIGATKSVINLSAGTTLDLRNNAATNFGYPVVLAGASGSTFTFNVDRVASGTALFHAIGPVSVPAAAQINVTGGNSFGLTTGTMTLAGNLTLNPTSGQLAIGAIDAGAASPARTITKTGAFPVTVNGAGTNFAGTTTVNVTAGAVFLGDANAFGPAANITATNSFSQIGQTAAAAAGYKYALPADGVLAGNAAFFNSLTVGGNINLVPPTIAETVAGGNAAAATAFSLPNDASRFYGFAGTITENVTVGTGTPWAGISNDNAPARSYAGTMTANSDFAVRATNGQTFALNAVTFTPAVARTMTVTGGVVTFNSSSATYNSNVTIAVANGATVQPTVNTAFGASTTPASNAAINVLNGGAFNPNAGVTVNNTVTIQPGGILNIDDANNLAGTGSYVQFPGSVTRITNAAATALGGAMSAGTVPGSIVRLQVDGIGLLPSKVNNAAIFEVNVGNRLLIAGTPAAPSLTLNASGTVTIGSSTNVPTGVLTNDNASRTLNNASTTSASVITVGSGGATFVATDGTTFTVAGSGTNPSAGTLSVLGGSATINIGVASPVTIDGVTKGASSGVVAIGGPTDNLAAPTVGFAAGAINVLSGTFTHNGGGIPLQVGGSGTFAPAQGTITSSTGVGALTVNPGTTFLSTTGVLVDARLVNNGTTRLTSGAPQISSIEGAGNLVLGAATATAADVALTVGSNGLSTTYAGVISQNITSPNVGKLTKVGTGTLTLAGNNTYTGATTISTGTLQLGAGGAAGTVAGAIANNAALVVNRANDFALPGAISGTGTLTKTGAGTLTLSAAPTYTGSTTVAGGGLTISAATTSFPTSGLSVAGGARFSYLPAAVGALSLGGGTLSLADGSQVGLAFGSSIATTGAATTAGTVNFAIPTGAAFTSGQAYTFLTAGSGLDAANYAVLNPGNFTYAVSKSATAVTITPTTATAAATLFWKGGYAGNLFTASNGDAAAPQSNFATDAAGTTV